MLHLLPTTAVKTVIRDQPVKPIFQLFYFIFYFLKSREKCGLRNQFFLRLGVTILPFEELAERRLTVVFLNVDFTLSFCLCCCALRNLLRYTRL